MSHKQHATKVGDHYELGMAGRVRLIYASVYPLLDRMSLSPDDWLAMLDDITSMEVEALKTMNEHRKK